MKITLDNDFILLTPYKYRAEYLPQSGKICIYYFYGDSREECIQEIFNKEEEFGECVLYAGINDDDYSQGELTKHD